MTMDRHRNPDGTYNGVTFFAAITGLPPEEIRWTWERTKALHGEGKSKAEIKRIVAEEAKLRPWAQQP